MSNSAIHRSAQSGFSIEARAYAKGRPDYPPQIVEWLRDELELRAGTTVLDLGAGTGKFLPSLAATGATIVAVEPVAAMRAQLAAHHPTIAALDGTAARIPCEDAALDAVVCAQCFHWFATREALAEIRRVLKPGGALGLIWNKRDIDTPWVAAIDALIEPHRGNTPAHESGQWRGVFPADGFGPLSERTFEHGHRGDTETVVIERMRSISFVAALPPDERDQVVAKLRALVRDRPELAGRSEVIFPYRTVAYRCSKT